MLLLFVLFVLFFVVFFKLLKSYHRHIFMFVISQEMYINEICAVLRT